MEIYKTSNIFHFRFRTLLGLRTRFSCLLGLCSRQFQVLRKRGQLGHSSEETTASEIIEFENLYIGDIVEVYWEGENKWFEGHITNVDAVDRLFEVFYKIDSEKF